MKRILLAGLCLLVLLLAGCVDVNQTNSFVEVSTPEATLVPEGMTTTEETKVPDVTVAPGNTLPPMVQLDVKPTWPPDATDVPSAPPETPDPTPESGTSNLNG